MLDTQGKSRNLANIFRQVILWIGALGLGIILFALFNPTKANAANHHNLPPLFTHNKNVLQNGHKFTMKGVNAGGLFETEKYMSNVPNKNGWRELLNNYGTKAADTWNRNYWSDADFKNIKDMGFNTIRLPFTYMNLINYSKYNNNPNNPDLNAVWKPNAFRNLDRFISKANSYGLYVVLDLHGAFGSQNGQEHSGQVIDNGEGQGLYGNRVNENLTDQLWAKIANHYRNWTGIAGYDLLNEPNTQKYTGTSTTHRTGPEQWNYYNRLFKTIRFRDPHHIVIMESCWDPVNLPNPAHPTNNFLGRWANKNVVYEFHEYPDSTAISDNAEAAWWDNIVENIKDANYNVPVYMGEFSLTENKGYTPGANQWSHTLNLFNHSGFSWTVWNYRTKASSGNWGIFHEDSQDISPTSPDFGKPKNVVPNNNIYEAIEQAAKSH